MPDKTSYYRKLIIIILLSLLIFVGLDLLLARVFVGASGRTFRTNHPYYHHGMIPNQMAMTNWAGIPYPVYTNSLGFIDQSMREIPLETHKRRMLFMGDSHTEGVGLRFEDTFTGQLIELLDSSRVEILNAAAVSYSHKIYYLKTRYLIENTGLRFDEIYVFMDISDIQNELVYAGFQPGKISPAIIKWMTLKNKMNKYSFTINTLSSLWHSRQTSRFLKKTQLFDAYRSDENHTGSLDLYASFFREFDDKTLLSNPMFHGVDLWMYDDHFAELALHGMNLGKNNLKSLYELCHQHGIEMTLVVHPWQKQIKFGIAEDMYVKFWKEFSDSLQIGFINLYPAFIDPPVSAAFGMEFFLPNDNHWNKNGHWLVANEVLKHIQDKVECRRSKATRSKIPIE